MDIVPTYIPHGLPSHCCHSTVLVPLPPPPSTLPQRLHWGQVLVHKWELWPTPMPWRRLGFLSWYLLSCLPNYCGGARGGRGVSGGDWERCDAPPQWSELQPTLLFLVSLYTTFVIFWCLNVSVHPVCVCVLYKWDGEGVLLITRWLCTSEEAGMGIGVVYIVQGHAQCIRNQLYAVIAGTTSEYLPFFL